MRTVEHKERLTALSEARSSEPVAPPGAGSDAVFPADEAPSAERLRVLALLKRHGWNATSFQILERGFRYWFDTSDAGDEACIGYVDTGRAWVAAGSPVAPPERFAELCERFAGAAAEAGRQVCAFATESRFLDAAPWARLRIGDQPVWSPTDWTAVLQTSRSLREQLRRARAKGVAVRALDAGELAPGHATRRALDELIARWLASRAIAPMGFLVHVEPFTFVAERRYFVAERAGAITGFLCAIPVYARRGWFFEDFVRAPDAPNGTVELLIDAGMRAAAAEQVGYVTLGLVPLSGEVGPWLRAARRWSRALYDFDGLRAFKAKLKPRAWDPIYLSYPHERSGVGALVDTLTAFSRGGLLRFGIETLLRSRAIAVRVLLGALVLAVVVWWWLRAA